MRVSTLFLVLVAMPFLLLPARAAQAEVALPELVEKLGSEDNAPRMAAYNELLRRKDPAAAILLQRAIPTYTGTTSQLYGLYVLQYTPGDETAKALEALSKIDDSYVSLLAAGALCARGNEHGIQLVVELLGQTNLNESHLTTMLYRLTAVKEPRVAAAVAGLLDSDRSVALVGAALYVLQFMAGAEFAPQVNGLLEDEDAGIRAMAAAWLHRFAVAGSGPLLAKALETGTLDSTSLSRITTFLQQTPTVDPAVLDAVVNRLDDGDDDVNTQTQLIRLLGRLGHRPAASVLRRLMTHDNQAVADAAFEALSAMPGALSPDSLTELLKSGSLKQRLKAAIALRKMDDWSGLDVIIEIAQSGEPESWEATRELGAFRTPKVVPILLERMESNASQVRGYALTSLQQVWQTIFPYRRFDFGRTGFSALADDAARAEGLKIIRAWWNENKDAAW